MLWAYYVAAQQCRTQWLALPSQQTRCHSPFGCAPFGCAVCCPPCPLLQQLLKATCFVCHRLRVPHIDVYLLIRQLRLLDFGLLVAAKELESAVSTDETHGTNAAPKKADNDEESSVVTDAVDRIDNRFHRVLAEAGLTPADTPNPTQKFATCNQARDEFTHAFFAKCASCRSCQSCGAIARTIIQEAQTKVIAKPLKAKSADVMKAKGLFEHTNMGNVTALLKVAGGSDQSKVHRTNTLAVDEGAEMDEDTQARSTWHEQVYIMPDQARKHLLLLWNAEKDLMPIVFKGSRVSTPDGTFSTADMFFLRVLPVPACRFRPPCVTADQTLENAHTVRLSEVLKSCREVRLINRNTDDVTDEIARAKQLQIAWTKLQTNVNVMIDAGLETGAAAVDAAAGIKQVLEKKEGLFRMHMMGKRVNYACRSVIGPDPMVGTHEIGIPKVFAIKLTYPEPVTTYNVNRLRAAVIKGTVTLQ